MGFGKIALFLLAFVSLGYGDDLYPSYNVTIDPAEERQWSDNPALAYIGTARLFDYDHHIYQYRRYPCQFFYTDEIQLYYTNETINQCISNSTTNEYDFHFQLHLDSRHVDPYILQNVALKCNYTNCSLSLLNMTYLHIGWSLQGKEKNPNCSFDIYQPYNILHTPYTVTEMIRLQCKSLVACTQAKLNLDQAFTSVTEFIYGSAFELQKPYCSLERSVRYVVETSLAETNRLLVQLVGVFQQFSTTPTIAQDILNKTKIN